MVFIHRQENYLMEVIRMEKKFIVENKINNFYPVSEEEIQEVEQILNLNIPRELKKLYSQLGYGFLNKTEYNINRIMDPYSIRDFRLRQNDFEFYPDIEIYDQFEEKKLIFFEANESALISIELSDREESSIYYYNTIIATSLREFLIKIQENDNYYVDLLK